MQWSGWMLLIGLILLSTTSPASPSNASPRELKALRAALKKQQRLKEQRSSSASGINSKGVGGTGTAGSSSIGGSGEYVPDAGPWASSSMDGGGKEPSCEQLREMWRQSKRHSRAAEATNEIPQYADPFARAAALHYGRQRQQQLGYSGAEPTLRPRQERRPVVYGRLHSSPSSLDGQEVVDRPPRPFDVLRKLSRTESADGGSASSDGQNSGARSGVVLYGEEDRSPFPKSPAKGSLQHLRELVREEQSGGGQLPSGVKGSFQQLRDIVREENREGRPSSSSSSSGRSSDWSDADVGRVVTSPSDHSSSSVGGSKYSLFAMQGDAPYESPSSLSAYQQQHSSSASSNNRRPSAGNNNNYNRLSSFGKSHHRNHNINRQQMSDLLASDPTAAAAASSAAVMASRRPFQLRDPPRPKIGSSRLVGSSQRAANNNRWSSSSSSSGGSPDSSNDDDVGVVRGYVAGGGRTNANPFYSSPPAKPSRRSSALADEEEEDDCGDIGEESDPFCRINSDCRCASLALGVQQRCQRGRCVPMSNRKGQPKQKRQQRNQKRKSSTSLRRRRLEDDQVDDDEWRTSDRDVESRLEQLLQEEEQQQQQQQSEDEEESSADESRSSSRPSGRKADAIRDIIDALQQIDQQQESTD